MPQNQPKGPSEGTTLYFEGNTSHGFPQLFLQTNPVKAPGTGLREVVGDAESQARPSSNSAGFHRGLLQQFYLFQTHLAKLTISVMLLS